MPKILNDLVTFCLNYLRTRMTHARTRLLLLQTSLNLMVTSMPNTKFRTLMPVVTSAFVLLIIF